MTEQFSVGKDFQRVSKESFDASVRSYGEANKVLQTIAAETANFWEKTFDDATRAFDQLLAVKPVEAAFEIHSQYAKKAYETYMAGASKLGEMCLTLALSAYKPFEDAFAKRRA
jgi:hypothetical protein